MKELLELLIQKILGEGEFSVEETTEGDQINYKITLPEDKAGLVIGKGGRTIKAIRNLLKVRATLEHKLVYLSVN